MHKTLTALAAAAALTFAVVAAPQQADARWRGTDIGTAAAASPPASSAGLPPAPSSAASPRNQGYYGDGYYYGSPGYYGRTSTTDRATTTAGLTPTSPRRSMSRPVPRVYRGGGCWIETDSTRGYGYYGPCR